MSLYTLAKAVTLFDKRKIEKVETDLKKLCECECWSDEQSQIVEATRTFCDRLQIVWFSSAMFFATLYTFAITPDALLTKEIPHL